MSTPITVTPATVLVVDDTPANISVLLGLLGEEGHKVLVAKDGESALEQLKFVQPDLILLDVMMPGLDGFEVCRRVKQLAGFADTPILFLTALDEPEDKLKGFAAGAADYVAKPLRHPEVMARVNVHLALHQALRQLRELNIGLEQRVVARTAELSNSNAELTRALTEIESLKAKLQAENAYLREELDEHAAPRAIVGQAPALRALLARIALVAPTTASVFISGETGTGKELIARAIHDGSPRAARNLVKLNCAAISAGLVESELFGHAKGAFTGATDKRVGRFELADGGTLFLDEVSELPLETQVKLLRVLQEQEFEPVGSSRTMQVDVRVIAASNRDLATEVIAGRFRADLYHRLNVFPLAVPPLRDRIEDIPLLAEHFLARITRRMNKTLRGIEAESLQHLMTYTWPGNIRELQNVIERSAILSRGEWLEVEPLALQTDPSLILESAIGVMASAEDKQDQGDALAAVQRRHILAILRKTRGIIEGTQGAARLLNMKPSTVRYRMKILGIERHEFS